MLPATSRTASSGWSGVNDCEHHPENPYQILAIARGTYKACTESGVCGSVYVDRGPAPRCPHPPAGREWVRVVIDAGVKVRVVSGFRGLGAEGD